MYTVTYRESTHIVFTAKVHNKLEYVIKRDEGNIPTISVVFLIWI